MTNQDLINELSKFPLDAPVRFSVSQRNKVNSTYLNLGSTKMADGSIVDMVNGRDVTVNLSLPSDATHFTVLTRLKKR